MLLKKWGLFALVAMPLQTPDGWIPLTYSGKTANTVTHSPAGIEIKVNASASPLFYKFKAPYLVDKVEATGTLSALPTSEKEDSALRIGLVTEGKTTLNWVQRLFAPAWLKQLMEIAPGTGLGEVLFLVIAGSRELGDTVQVRSGITEIVAGQASEAGPFTLVRAFEKPMRVSALWIQADGDDSKSTFVTQLNRLTFQTRD